MLAIVLIAVSLTWAFLGPPTKSALFDGPEPQRAECEALRGAYIDGYCLDLEQISLDGGRR